MKSESVTLREILERLRPGDRTGDAAAAAAMEKYSSESAAQQTPWFVRALIAVSAWIAALMFLVFVFGANIVSSSGGAIGLGAPAVIAAVYLRRTQGRVLFAVQLALALSLAGQVMLIGGIGDQLHTRVGALAAVFVSIALIVLYPDKVHRFLSTLIAVGGAVVFAYDVHLRYGLQVITISVAAAAGHLWYYESHLMSGPKGPMIRPAAYGLISAALFLLTPSMVTPEYHRHLGISPGWAPVALALTGLLLMIEYRLLLFHGGLGRKKLAAALFLGTGALAAASFNAPGIIGALFVLVIGFHRGDRIITGLAVAFLVVFLSAYYYNLEITLLTKSYALLATGGVLLLLRPLLVNALRNERAEVSHE